MDIKAKDRNKRLLTILLIILAILSTALAVKVYAEKSSNTASENPTFSKNSEVFNDPDYDADYKAGYIGDKDEGGSDVSSSGLSRGGANTPEISSSMPGLAPSSAFCKSDGCSWRWDLQDLKENWYLICAQKGQNIPQGGGCNYKITFNCICGEQCVGNSEWGHRETIKGTSHVSTDPNHGEGSWDPSTRRSYSRPVYSIAHGNHIGNPAESYILAEAAHGYPANAGSTPNGHRLSEVQQAMWNTYIGRYCFNGQPGMVCGLWREAEAFQKYICNILGIDDPGQEGSKR